MSNLAIISDFSIKIDICVASKPYSTDCLIDANNDLQAVQSWLMQYASKNTTFLTYKREAHRLLLWCIHEAGKTLGELKTEDFTNYIIFLGKPPSRWCSSRRSKQRPFVGPLSDSARITTIRVINSLMNYLVDAGYLRANPLRLIKQHSKFNLSSEEYKYTVWSKILDNKEWQALQQALQDMPEQTYYEKDNKMRTQFIFACLYLLGLRISEIATSTWNSFKFHQDAWWFFVKGKGDKLGHVPVNDQLLAFIKAYRNYIGKSSLPEEADFDNLIISKKTSRALSSKQIYTLIKNIGEKASAQFDFGTISNKKLLNLSPHSLRHLSASHQDRAGIAMNMIQANLRHASLHTTKIYVHADDRQRSEAMQKIKFDVSPELLKSSVDNKLDLMLKISGKNVCQKYSLNRLLDSIEQNIFKITQWNRVSIHADDFGLSYNLHYQICNISHIGLSQIKQQIIREAEIRLYRATVIINSH